MTAKVTKEHIIRELKKCSNDYIYTLMTYGKIVRPGAGGLVPFDMFDFQEKLIDVFDDQKNTIILKSRQMGITTIVAGYAACELVFKSYSNVLALAMKADIAKNIVAKTKTFIHEFPRWLRPGIERDNVFSLVLKNGSEIKAVSGASDSARSEAASFLIIDEAAFISGIEDTWAAAQQTLAATNGKSVVLSTPNGIGNWFHKTWQDAIAERNNFYFIELPWYLHPERDQAWRDAQDRELGPRLARQECDASFESSGNTIFEPNIIKTLEEKTKDPKEKRGHDKNLWIWKQPQSSSQYIVSADVASEWGDDFCAAHVLDVEKVEQVAEYQGHKNPADFGHMLVDIAQHYNNALLIIENNSLGLATIQPAIDRQYENLFWSKRGSLDYVDPNDIYYEEKNSQPGFNTNTKTRPLIIQRLEDYINEDLIRLHSIRTIQEVWTFISQRGKPIAADGAHDDLIMSLAIGLWVRDTALRLKNNSDEFDQNRHRWITRSQADKTGPTYNGIYTSGQNQDPYKIRIGDHEEDIRWLLE